MPRKCTTPAKILNKEGGTKGMWSNPHQQQSTINLHHSLPDPKPKPTLMKAVKKRGQQEVTPVPFLNTDPIVHLVGHSNEAPVVVDGQETTALIDSGSHVSSVSAQFCKDLTLQIQPLGQLLELEGTGGAAIPYSDLCRLTSRFWGLEITTRTCCCWLSPPQPILRGFLSWLVLR